MCDDTLDQVPPRERQDCRQGEEARPFHGPHAVAERTVAIATADGVVDAVLHHPNELRSWPAVLVWPDIMGLRPVFHEMGSRLAAHGYTVLTPNPYYRVERAPIVGPSFNFADPEQRGRIFALRSTLSDKHVESDSAAFVAFLDQLPQTDGNQKMGVHGYCLGGAFALRSAATVPDRVGAVASFHGAGLVTDGNSSPHLLIPRTSARYLIAVAQNDDTNDPNARKTLASTLEQASLQGGIEVFPANHGWCVCGSAAYDEAQAENAWGQLLAHYEAALTLS